MSNFSDGWQDRAILYLQSLADISRGKTKLIYVRLCDYALSKHLWENGKLTLDITVDEMATVCNATRSSIITALNTLTKCGAMSRERLKEFPPKSVTIINFVDD